MGKHCRKKKNVAFQGINSDIFFLSAIIQFHLLLEIDATATGISWHKMAIYSGFSH